VGDDIQRVVIALLRDGWTEVQAGTYNFGSGAPARYSRAALAREIAQQLLGQKRGSRAIIDVDRDPTKFSVASPPDVAMDSTRLMIMSGVRLSNIVTRIREIVQRRTESSTSSISSAAYLRSVTGL